MAKRIDREVAEGEIEVFREKLKVKKWGGSAHIPMRKEFEGSIAEVRIKKKWRICQRCHETIPEQFFSPDPHYCDLCYKQEEKLQELKKTGEMKCKICHKPIDDEDFHNAWGDNLCYECFDKESDKLSRKQSGSDALMKQFKTKEKEELNKK